MKRAVGSRCGGLLSRELVQTWRTPGWHVLPNGIVAYADPVATQFLDARDNFDAAGHLG